MGATLGGMALRAEAQSMTTRPKRPRNYSGVMLPLCMVVLATLPAFVVGENRTVRSSADFFEALAVPNISAIHLANDITLQVVDAPPRTIELKSSVTIYGASTTSNYTLLHCNYLGGRIRLNVGVILSLVRIVLSGTLRGTGQQWDIITASPGGAVALINSINARSACLPFDVALKQLQSLPVANPRAGVSDPPGLVGLAGRNVSVVNNTNFCYSTTTRTTCKSIYLSTVAYGTAIQATFGTFSSNGGYNSFLYNSYGTCDVEVSYDCLARREPDLCLAALLLSLGETTQGQQGGGGDSSSAKVGLAVGMGVGLGGGLLLVIVIAVILVRRSHRAAAAAAAAAANPGKSSADSGGPGGAVQDSNGYKVSTNDPHSRARSTVTDVTDGGAGSEYDDLEKASGALPRQSGGPGGGSGGSKVRDGGLLASVHSAGTKSVATATSATVTVVTDAPKSSGQQGTPSGEGAAGTPSAAAAAAALAASGSNPHAMGEVEAARLNVLVNAAQAAGRGGRAVSLDVKVLQLLGQGSFGKVYKGVWLGQLVALKAQVLPPSLSGDARRRHMAVMEAAISSAINHPAIVQTYCYSYRPILDLVGRGLDSKNSGPEDTAVGTPAGGTGGTSGGTLNHSSRSTGKGGEGENEGENTTNDYGHELLLVLEYCDGGSLRQALDRGVFHRGWPWPFDARRASLGGQQLPPFAAAAHAAAVAAAEAVAAQSVLPRPSPAQLASPPRHGATDSTLSAGYTDLWKANADVVADGGSGGTAVDATSPPRPQLQHAGDNTTTLVTAPPFDFVAAATGQVAAAPAAGGASPDAGGELQVANRHGSTATSSWRRADMYEPDFALGRFEVVLPATGPAPGVGTAGGGITAAGTSFVSATLAGAPTLASSWVSSAFNNTSSALAAADNAAAAAAADRLAVMMMLQQAAHTALQQQQQSPPSPPQQQQPQLHPEQAGGEVEQGQGKGEGQRQLDASMDATVAAQDQQQQLQQAAGGGGALPAPPPGAAAVRQSSVLSPQMGAGAGGPGAVEAASADWAGPRGSYDGWQGVGQGQRGGAGGRPLPLPPPSYRYGLMLALAADVASGLLHLHQHGVVHGDVKASNVLLKQIVLSSGDMLESAGRSLESGLQSDGSADPLDGLQRAATQGLLTHAAMGHVAAAGAGAGGRTGTNTGTTSSLATGGGAASGVEDTGAGAASSGVQGGARALGPTASRLGVCAKVSDFGLSTLLSVNDTHISATTAAGSLSHMSPELLLHGHVSKAVDTYAFAILLYELFTGERAWDGMPRVLLPARVALDGMRPVFPPWTPPAFRQLAERCWHGDPAERPSFDEILTTINDLRQAAVAAGLDWVPIHVQQPQQQRSG